MENKNITTGEIVRALRFCGDDNTTCVECVYTSINADGGCFSELSNIAADRLESQEWEIERLQGEMFANALESAERIATLTARAEQAERERDAAKAYMKRLGCLTCTGQGTLALNDPCGNCRDKSKWEMRGLPQEGEGKQNG